LDATTLVYDEFVFRLYLQYDGRCFPANNHFVDFEHQLILDSATLVHDELVFVEFIVCLHL
jgi:hypothetical protein